MKAYSKRADNNMGKGEIAGYLNVLTSRVIDVESFKRFGGLENAGNLSARANTTETEQLEKYQNNSVEYVSIRYVASQFLELRQIQNTQTSRGLIMIAKRL